MNMPDWNLIRAFEATAETGSLSAAARRLGLTQPTLSRQIAALESALGATLFDRVGKKLVLTLTGHDLLDHARTMGSAAEMLALAAAGRAQDIGGQVRISASDAFAAYLMPEMIEKLRLSAPQITISIVASNALSDLRRREADIAIRHVRPSEPELIGQLVSEMEAGFYASESWLARHPAPSAPSELPPAMLLAGEPLDRFCDYLRDYGLALKSEDIRISSENSVVLWEMVRQGLGIGLMLREIAERTPGITPILDGFPLVTVPVWLVTHREMRTSRRIRTVFDILAGAIRDASIPHRKASAPP